MNDSFLTTSGIDMEIQKATYTVLCSCFIDTIIRFLQNVLKSKI